MREIHLPLVLVGTMAELGTAVLTQPMRAPGVILLETDYLLFTLGANLNGVRIGRITDDDEDAAGYGKQLYLSGGPSFVAWDSDNSDPLWLARYNVAADETELRVNIGDNGLVADAFVLGYTTGGTWFPVYRFPMDGSFGGGAHDLLDGATHSDTVAQVVTRGSLIYGNGTPAWDELVIGAVSAHLESDGTDVAWQANLTMADDAWIGLGGAAGRLAFDSTPAPDQATFSDCEVGIGLAPNYPLDIAGIIGIDGVQTIYIPDQADFTGTMVFGDGGTNLSHGAGVEGQNNFIMGIGAGAAMTTGNRNVVIGTDAGDSITTAQKNIVIGAGAGRALITTNDNLFIGSDAGRIATGSGNFCLGTNAGYGLTTGISNLFIGSSAGFTMTSSSSNVLVGANAGQLMVGGLAHNNVMIGAQAGQLKTSGLYNVFIGYWAGRSNTSKHYNTFIGYQSGSSSTSQSSVFLGYQAGQNETGSNKLFIANSNTASPLIYGEFDGASVGIRIHSPAAAANVLVVKGAAAQSGALLQLLESDDSVFLDSGDGLGGSVFSGNQQLEDVDFVWAGDTEANLLRIDAGTNRVGIGEVAPASLLELSSTVPYLTLHNTTHEDSDGGRESRAIFRGEQSGGEESSLAWIEACHDGAADDEKGSLKFFTNDGSDGDAPTERMILLSSGMVGINTSSPDEVLTIQRITGNADWISLKDQAGNTQWRWNEPIAGDLSFTEHGVADGRFHLQAGGNIGIGTTTPGTLLEIVSTSPYLTIHNSTEEDADGGREGRIIFEGEQSGGEISALAWIEAHHDGASDGERGNLVFFTNSGTDGDAPTERMRLDSSGDLTLDKISGRGIKVDLTAPTFGWRDLLGDVFSRNTGASKPSFTTYRDTLLDYQFAAGDEEYFKFHIPHDYVAGTDIHLHFHWSHIGALVTGGTVTFEYEASYAKGHNQAPFPASVSGTVAGTASTTQYQHIISEGQLSASAPAGSQIDSDDLEPDGVIIMRVGVQANNITVSGGGVPDPFIHYVDIHYQSTNLGTKQKAPDFYS